MQREKPKQKKKAKREPGKRDVPRSFARRLTYSFSRWASRLTTVGLCQLRCDGRENFPREGAALVCSNHQSFLDPILIGLTCPRQLNYLARSSLFRIPVFRWLIDWYDAIPIEREGTGLGGVKETLKRIRRGEMVVVFPEGTRTTDGSIGPLKPGICALARRGKVPLIPMTIDGAHRVWPRHRPFPWPARIAIRVGPPIPAEEVASLDDEQLLLRLTQALNECHQLARQRCS